MILTAKSLAERWQVSPALVYRLARTGAIPSFKVGDAVRFNLSQIEEYEKCASNSTEANGASTGGTTRDSLYDALLVRATDPRQNAGSPSSSNSDWFVPPIRRES